MEELNSKICFILLPGFAPDSVPVLKLKKEIGKKGYATIATNFFGEQKINDFSKLTIEQCFEAVTKIINNTSLKYEKVIGVGVSLGGALLLEHAKNNNDLSGIISIGTPFYLKRRKLISVGELLFPIFYPFWRIIDKNKKLRLPPIGAGSMVINYLENGFLKDLEKIKTPVLFIHSKKDTIADYRVLPKFSSKISDVYNETIISQNGNHARVMDNDTDTIVNHLEYFLKKI